jgi:hypothetical protein
MYQYNLTKSSKTLAAVLREHNPDKHFQFEDYNAAVKDKNLTPGLEVLFLGHLGTNFGGATGFNNSHPILCQMDCEATKSTNQRQFFQWVLFFPHMNTVMTCHNCIGSGKTKHAWVLGPDILGFFKDNNSGRIDRHMGKIFSPHKADNTTDVKLNSAVFLTAKSRNSIDTGQQRCETFVRYNHN